MATLAFFCTTLNAFAASSLPDINAQELQREQERGRVLREQQAQTPDVRLERSSKKVGNIPTDESPCFPIRQILMTGEAAEQFRWALKASEGANDSPIDRCLGSEGVNIVLRRIQNAILERGYVTTRVLAAPQDLKTGTLAVTIVPGRIKAIRFAEGTSRWATRWNAIPASAGDILNLRDIEQGLENFKRVPTVDADIQIVPGEAPGESDLDISWKQAFPVRLGFSLDNSGSDATGKYQGGITLSVDNPLALNDLFYIALNHDLGGGDKGNKGTKGYTAHYEIPYGDWSFGVTSSEYRYHQEVAGFYENYEYSGTSNNLDMTISRMVYRDAVRKTQLYLQGWYKSSKNFIDDTEIEIQRRRMAGWKLGVTHKEFIGTSTLDMDIAYRRGTGAHHALTAPEEMFNEGSSRSIIITADVSLSVPFSLGAQSLRYDATWRAQWNRTPLVPLDRFSIGGRYTVRGFDGELTLSSDRGWFVRNDLSFILGTFGAELYGGIDYGRVGGESAQYLLGDSLAGAVLGLRGNYKQFGYSFFVGKPLYKPERFRTANTTTGFSLSWSF